MNKYIAILLLMLSTLSFGTPAYADKIELEKKDYLTLIVGNYVHGFKDFDTSVTASDDLVSIIVYYDNKKEVDAGIFSDTEQYAGRIEDLAKKFQQTIPELLKKYSWAKGVTVKVSIKPKERGKEL